VSGQGFQFTPYGILPLGAAPPVQSDEPAPSIVQPAPQVERVVPTYAPARPLTGVADAKPSAVAVPQAGLTADKPLTAKQLKKVAKARIRQLDKILKQMPALEAERASLKRIIDAAEKPAAVVRPIRASGA